MFVLPHRSREEKGMELAELCRLEPANSVDFLCDKLDIVTKEHYFYFWVDSTYWLHRSFDLLDELFDILDLSAIKKMIRCIHEYNAKV
jgi:hypothetical protein